MILDMGDGREIKLPDEVSDEFALALKRLILGNEDRARAAEARAADLELRLAALEAKVPDYAPITVAIGKMHESTVNGFGSIASRLEAVERAARADRVMVPDELGEYTRSRAVK